MLRWRHDHSSKPKAFNIDGEAHSEKVIMRVEISQISNQAFSSASLPLITRVFAAARKNTIFGRSNNMTPISIKDIMYGYGATTSSHPMNSLHVQGHQAAMPDLHKERAWAGTRVSSQEEIMPHMHLARHSPCNRGHQGTALGRGKGDASRVATQRRELLKQGVRIQQPGFRWEKIFYRSWQGELGRNYDIWQVFLLREDYLLMFDKMIIVTSASRS